MDDIYAYLKLDHKKVKQLFLLYDTAPSTKNKIEIVEMINQELTVHAESEEATFYNELKKHTGSKKDIIHSEKEHQQIKDKLKELHEGIALGNSKLDKKIKELKTVVEHHVSEEEGKIFKEAKKILTKEDAYILKEQMHTLKGKILLSKFCD